MKLTQMKIRNFRSYRDEVVIDFTNLTAFVGKNDIGKSTILEALDIFFETGIIKFDTNDINKECNSNGDTESQIAVVFDDYPQELILDSSNATKLQEEYLLNIEGKLEIIKKYSKGGKPKIFIKANHPTNKECSDLHSKKNSELKTILKDKNLSCEDQTKNAELRKAIWNHYSQDLQLQEIEIELNKEDAKSIWEQLKTKLPHYALFQSDRSNSDQDSEVQNPLKSAVGQIFKDEKISEDLKKIADIVIQRLDEITKSTLDKLREMNPQIAESLNPKIPSVSDLKWQDVFKNISIAGDENIPINKRGSGVKRLILLNFFRAEAERKKKESSKANVIYAIEEPETSQHHEHQKILIKAFIELAEQEGIQIILTTHSSNIVKALNFENLRVIKNENGKKEIMKVEESMLPIPSLNEVNYLAFGEVSEEYHNELYGYLGWKKRLDNYLKNQPKIKKYKKQRKDGEIEPEKDTSVTQYIRDQIHHPENKYNEPYTQDELQQSIQDMRDFIKKDKEEQPND